MNQHVGASAAPVLSRRRLYADHLKRLGDLAAVFVAAPILLPLVALFALLVRLDGGSAFYGQIRVGRNGRLFTCWKLRTMVPDADACLATLIASDPEVAREWRVHQKLSCDPRITPFGRILRASSLDELPQLWNVFVGDMSLVGPRPMTPDQQSMYPGSAYYRLRPGLTCYWQVSDRHNDAFAGRAAHDARYANEISLLTDLALLIQTVGVVVRGTGV